jgi:methylated-DNA-protein-cysteine methyltransferase-like protein
VHVPAQAAPEFVTQIRSKGLAPVRPTTTFERIHAVIRRIPPGRVATYGQVARIAGLVNGARQVGYALHALREGTAVPWFRVVNARGASSLRSGGDVTQQLLLAREGIRFGAGGRIDLAVHGWRPRRRTASVSRG